MAPRLLVPLVLGAGALVAGCGGAPTTGDFADEAEQFIEGDMARNTQLNGLTFTDTTCEEPTSTAAGTEYTCTATGSDGVPRTLTVKIASRNSLQVVEIDPGPPANAGDPAGPTPATTPATATPATTAPPSG